MVPEIVVDDYEQPSYRNIDTVTQPGDDIYGQLDLKPPTGDTPESPVETPDESNPRGVEDVEQPAMANVSQSSAVTKDTTVTFDEPAVVDVQLIDSAGNDTEPPPLVIVEPVSHRAELCHQQRHLSNELESERNLFSSEVASIASMEIENLTVNILMSTNLYWNETFKF